MVNSSAKIFKDNVIYEFKNNYLKQPITFTQVNKQLLKEISFHLPSIIYDELPVLKETQHMFQHQPISVVNTNKWIVRE